MYRFAGCFKIDQCNNTIDLDKYFIKDSSNSTVSECRSVAIQQKAPFFALTDGNEYKSTCYIGDSSKPLSTLNDYKYLINSEGNVTPIDICNIDLSGSSYANVCGFNTPYESYGSKNIYAGSNVYSMYVTEDLSISFRNLHYLEQISESSQYFKNKLSDISKNFFGLLSNIKTSYENYILNRAENQCLSDFKPTVSGNPAAVYNANIQALINNKKDYENLINNLVTNSKIVLQKLEIYNETINSYKSQINIDKSKLDNLLNLDRADNAQLFDNKLKKNVLLAENILIIIIILFIIFKIITKNNK